MASQTTDRDAVQAQIRQATKTMMEAQQALNRHQAIPRSNTGATENLGNAPTPPPLEPTINEPGYVVFQNPEPPVPAP